MVNHFIPVLCEPRTLTFDFERERGKSIKRLHVLRCQVTLAKRRVFFFYDVNKENGHLKDTIFLYRRKEERRRMFLNGLYILVQNFEIYIYSNINTKSFALYFFSRFYYFHLLPYIFKKFSKGEGKLNGFE